MSDTTRKTYLPRLICALALAMPGYLLAAPALQVEPGQGHYDLAAATEYMLDATSRLKLADVRSPEFDARFVPASGSVNLGFTSAAIWLRFSLELPERASRGRLLEFGYPMVDYIDVYWILPDGRVVTQHGGDHRPLTDQAVHHRNTVLAVPDVAGRLQAYIRVQTEGALQVPMSLWNQEAFIHETYVAQYGFGALYGVLGAMLLYNLLLWGSLRDSLYLYYVAYVASFGSFLATLDGFGYQYLWPGLPGITNTVLVLAVLTAACAITEFTRRFLGAALHFPVLNRILLAILASYMLWIPASLFVHQSTVLRFISVQSGITALITICVGLIALLKGARQARYYMLAWLVLLIAIVLYSLQVNGVIPEHPSTTSSLEVGLVLEVILISFALADRIRITEARNRQIQKESQEQLEAQVQERTEHLAAALRELSTAHSRLQELSTIDSLTGLRNRGYFDERKRQEIDRARREGASLSLIMLDIDGFKALNDRYGHIAGDAVLREVATAMEHCLRRPADLAARYGGEEFAVLLPNTDEAGAIDVAERIRETVSERCVRFGENDLSVTLSGGIATERGGPDDLVEAADQALYRAKAEGRNRVTVADEEAKRGVR